MLDIMQTKPTLLIVLATMLPPLAHAHSWVEELVLLSPNGSFTGTRGYPRGTIQRLAPGFSDTLVQWQLPPGNGSEITPDMHICRESQRTANYTSDSPMLQAPSGSFIALRYQENGHVTMPWVPEGKPQGSGAVYVYGTTQPSPEDKLADIYKVWTLDGQGGDQRGRLLTSQFYDDGQCYQINSSPKSVQRQQKFPRQAEAGSAEGANLWCQTDVKLPSNLDVPSQYTLYWVWDWSTMNTGTTSDKPQFYTTCMDVSITAADDPNQQNEPFVQVTNYGEAAISSIFEGLAGPDPVTVPATLTPGYFTPGQTDPTSGPAAAILQPPSAVTTSPGSPVGGSPVSQVVGVPAAAMQQQQQQPTMSGCSPTSTVTITTTAACAGASTVTTTETVTSTVSLHRRMRG